MFLLFAAGLLTSCGEKCSTCSYTYTVDTETITFSNPEGCGSSKEVDDYEDASRSAAEAAAAGVGGLNVSVSCVGE